MMILICSAVPLDLMACKVSVSSVSITIMNINDSIKVINEPNTQPPSESKASSLPSHRKKPEMSHAPLNDTNQYLNPASMPTTMKAYSPTETKAIPTVRARNNNSEE